MRLPVLGIVDAVTTGRSGTFNATGETTPLPDHLERSVLAAAHAPSSTTSDG